MSVKVLGIKTRTALSGAEVNVNYIISALPTQPLPFTVVEGGLMSRRQIQSDVSSDVLPDGDSLRDSAEDLNEFV